MLNKILTQAPETTSWDQGVDALVDALKTEAAVTKSIKQVIQKCEDDDKNNDYHVRANDDVLPRGYVV